MTPWKAKHYKGTMPMQNDELSSDIGFTINLFFGDKI
jgi:hypothetical protein